MRAAQTLVAQVTTTSLSKGHLNITQLQVLPAGGYPVNLVLSIFTSIKWE